MNEDREPLASSVGCTSQRSHRKQEVVEVAVGPVGVKLEHLTLSSWGVWRGWEPYLSQ